MINKQLVKLHFSKNASNYDRYANVQKKMSNILIKLLMEKKQDATKVKNILEIGSGTGYLTRMLTELFPCADITAIDISEGMIDETKPKFKNRSVNFICADIEEVPVSNTYDIIISNATFQWFNNMPLTIKKLYNALKINGILCFSTFGNYTFNELNKCFKCINKEMREKEPVYASQAFYKLEELTKLCNDALISEIHNNKFLVQAKEIFEYEYFNNCKEFFYSIKRTGANNSNTNNRCVSPTFIKKVINLYNKNFMESNKVRATYHCLFYSIQK